MAQFDVYKVEGDWFALDIQSDLLSHLESRLTVPLERLHDSPKRIDRLNPRLELNGEAVVMLTQLAGAVPARALKQRIGSLAGDRLTITSAMDMLVSGF